MKATHFPSLEKLLSFFEREVFFADWLGDIGGTGKREALTALFDGKHQLISQPAHIGFAVFLRLHQKLPTRTPVADAVMRYTATVSRQVS
jgi:hypothetical protein